MAKITYSNKETLNAQPSIADKNKVTSDDMNEIKSVVNENDDTLISQGTIINNIKGTLLWTNENPTSAMSTGTTINLSSSDYDILEIFYITHVSNERNIKSIRALKGFNIDLEVINEAGTPYTRKLTRTNDTSYSAAGGYTYTSYGGGKTLTTNVCIPLYVIGYNTGLF